MTDSALQAPVTPATIVETGRSRADCAVRRLLQIPDEPPSNAAAADAHGTFTKSMLISATRCLLTYLVLPFLAPAVGFASGAGPWIGLPLSMVGIAANVVTIRRFWLADHRWRWHYSVIASGVIVLLAVLAVGDVAALAT